MTWNRIYQANAEGQTIEDLSHQNTNRVVISNTQAHAGTYSYRVGTANCLWGFPVKNPAPRNRLSYWFHHNGFSSVNTAMLYQALTGFTQYESPHIGIRINYSADSLDVVRPVSGTSNAYETLDSVPIPVAFTTTNAWLHFAFYHFLDETLGRLRMTLNGVTVIDYTGDTRAYGQGSGVPLFATEPAYIWMLGNYQGAGSWLANNAYVDDIYADNSEDEEVGPIPGRIFGTRFVTGAGANAEFTPLSGSNYENVDDIPPDGDTSYNKALIDGLKDTFQFSDVTVPTDYRIIAEIPTLFVKNLDAGPLVRVHAYDGSLYAHSADLTPDLDYNVPVWSRFTTQPDSSDWNESDGNAMGFGYESRGVFT